MITTKTLRAPLNWTFAGLSVLDIAIALILSVAAVALVSHDHGGAGACAGVLLMTLPVAFRRRAPME